MYIYQRGSTWWFRKAVPVDLIATLGVADVRRSLRTTSKSAAQRKALHMAICVQDVYDVLRSDTPLRASRELALSFLKNVLERNGLTHALRLIHPEYVSGRPPKVLRAWRTKAAADAPRADEIDERTALDILHSEKPRTAANAAAVELVETIAGIDSVRPAQARMAYMRLRSVIDDEKGAKTEPTAAAMLEKLRIDLLKMHIELRELRCRPVAATFDEGAFVKAMSEYERSRWSDQKLSKAIEEYVAPNGKRIKGKKKTKEDRIGRLAVFLRFIGDKEIRDIGHEDAVAYRNMVDELPDRWSLRFKTDDPCVAIEKNKDRKERFATVGKETAGKYMRPVRNLFDWLVDKGSIPKNPFDGVASNQEETKAANAKRIPLRIEQINKLLEKTYDGGRKLRAYYWIPRLMLFSGARPNELAQLQVEDLKHHHGRPHLSILCELDTDADQINSGKPRKDAPSARGASNGKADDRTVKTLAGKRLIPIHAKLIELGFVTFWNRRAAKAKPGMRVFIDATQDAFGGFYTWLSKRHNRLLEKYCGATDNQAMYSLRHNFEDACRACVARGEMTELTMRRFMGHQLPGMAAVYGDPLPRSDESPTIDAVAYPGLMLC